MPTDVHDHTEDQIHGRFQVLGRHLERSLADPIRMPGALPSHSRRPPGRRRALIAAMLVLASGTGIWMANRSTTNPTVVSTIEGRPVTTGPVSPTDGSTAAWPPPGEVHEHCAENEQTKALYANGDYPSEAVREQNCESRYHDLQVLVFTPDGIGPGTVSSAALRDLTASNEWHDALAAHGMDGNEIGTQRSAAELSHAFQNRHAIPVLNRTGQQIGWFGDGFVSLKDMAAVRADAERTIAEFEQSGTLPQPKSGG